MIYRDIALALFLCITVGCSSTRQEHVDVEDPDKEKIAQLLKQMEDYVQDLNEDMAQRQEAIKALAKMEEEMDRIVRAQLKDRAKDVEEALARMQELVKQVAKARATDKQQPEAPQEESEEVVQARKVQQALAHIESQMALFVKNRREQKRENAMQTLLAMEESVNLLARAEAERREAKRRLAVAALNKMDSDLTAMASEPRPWTNWDKSLFEERYGRLLLQVRASLERYRNSPS